MVQMKSKLGFSLQLLRIEIEQQQSQINLHLQKVVNPLIIIYYY